MSGNKGVIIGAAVVGICAIGWIAVLPGVIGMKAEEEVNAILTDSAKNEATQFQEKTRFFNRGWFFSTAQSEYQIMLGTKRVHLVVDHSINQFAIPFYRWAKINHSINSISFDGNVLPLPANLQASSDRLFFGGYSTLVSLPTYDYKEGELVITGTDLALQIKGKSSEKLTYNLDMPKLTISAFSEPLKLELVNFKMNGVSSANATPQEKWAQHGEVKFESFAWSKNNEPIFSIANFKIDGDLKDEGAHVGIIYKMHIDKVKFSSMMTRATLGGEGFDADNLVFNFSYNNLNKEALLNLSKSFSHSKQPVFSDVMTSNTDGNDSDDMNNQELAQIDSTENVLQKSGALILGSPSFKIDELSLKTTYGAFYAKAELDLDGKDFDSSNVSWITLQSALKPRLSGKGSFKIARDLMIKIGTDTDNLDQIQAKENMIKEYVAEGYIKDDGKDISSEAKFDKEGVVVNGKKM